MDQELDRTTNNVLTGMGNLAAYLGMSKSTVYRLIRMKKFPNPVLIKRNYKKVRAWFKNDLNKFRKEYFNKQIVEQHVVGENLVSLILEKTKALLDKQKEEILNELFHKRVTDTKRIVK